MIATAHIDLVRASLAERLAHGARVAAQAPTTPATIRTWGPRASVRQAANATTSPASQAPTPTEATVWLPSPSASGDERVLVVA